MMADVGRSTTCHDPVRRSLVLGGGRAAGMALSAAAAAEGPGARTDTNPRELSGDPVPEPSAERSARPVRPGRGSTLGGKVAVITGAEYEATGSDGAKDM